MAGRAADRSEDLFASGHLRGHRSARERRQELHERLEVVDATPTRPELRDVLRLRNRIADAQLHIGQVERELLRKEIVGDPHLVAIGIPAEFQ